MIIIRIKRQKENLTTRTCRLQLSTVVYRWAQNVDDRCKKNLCLEALNNIVMTLLLLRQLLPVHISTIIVHDNIQRVWAQAGGEPEVENNNYSSCFNWNPLRNETTCMRAIVSAYVQVVFEIKKINSIQVGGTHRRRRDLSHHGLPLLPSPKLGSSLRSIRFIYYIILCRKLS